MQEQSFPPPMARQTDPDTSHAAAADATINASAGRLAALRVLYHRSSTDFELASATGWQQTSIGKRRGECVAAGLVEKLMLNGAVVRRETPSGSMAIVWAITPKGRAFYLGAVG